MVARAKRPVIIAGLQARDARATGALRRLVQRWKCPVFTTWKAKGVIADDDPLLVGHYIGGPGEEATLAAADLGFTIQKQQATNQLLVNDGETSVIGGLTVTTVTRSRSGIPLLSGLPVIGKMFSYSSDDESRRDLIILVTPRIVDDGVTTP